MSTTRQTSATRPLRLTITKTASDRHLTGAQL